MAEPSRTAKQLQHLLTERIEAVPALRGRVTNVHGGGVIGRGLTACSD
jgi:hypothetical protein